MELLEIVTENGSREPRKIGLRRKRWLRPGSAPESLADLPPTPKRNQHTC